MAKAFTSTKMLLFITLMFLIAPMAARADFGLTTTTDFYTVDTGAGLVFSIRRVDHGSSTQSPGDIASLQIDGVEYQDQTRGSQINSGFDWVYSNTSAVTVTADVIDTDYIKITVQAGNLTHYYMAHRGDRRIYMATYFTTEPQLNLVRYILRIQKAKLPNGPVPADISQTVRTVESSDIFAMADGETRSKHYSNHRVVDWSSIGATGNDVGIWMVRDNYEGGSGGPFYRCLLDQGTSTDQEITYIVNYGEIQTEAMRTNILNHYTLVVTDGSAPQSDSVSNTDTEDSTDTAADTDSSSAVDIDTSWFSKMGLIGYIPEQQRGRVRANGISGMDKNYQYWAGFSNSQAQYWRRITPSGSFLSGHMIPGDYTLKIYKNELAVYTGTVSVKPHQTTALDPINITADPANDPVIWRIGIWDGSPQEFLNGDKVTYMHPSDVRMSSWVTNPYYIGISNPLDFPAYIWKGYNNDRTVFFKLTNDQLQSAHTLRIGMTVAYNGGRPIVKVNNWTSSIPAPSTQPNTRSLTVGSYRGNNVTYPYTIPASAWNTDPTQLNSLTITVVSGKAGTNFLSPGVSIDAIDLLQ